MSGPQVGLLSTLLKAIARLALPASVQIDYLRQRDVFPSIDELVLEFHDCAVLVPQFVARDWLTPQEASAITELDVLIDRMTRTKDEALWNPEALVSKPEWEELRNLARAALFEAG